ncbi:MAG: bis(5'-nucleosyl)-tetraphosphatase (symmetrical) YqeK [Lachnospiraceae bacterium]|nr:bis(5'-nucleosyl)-tetraphosphatase (symmetrical) YqeK [Lachnospiraceae bacterium]MDE7357819.1 bis(5'-nucleosyl)-tetraphosphatase (symmetrical) YqeK [Lachnospiraceae bacterium]
MSHNHHQPDLEKLRRAMEKELSTGRYTHTLGVAYTAAALAMAHNEDMEKAMKAGLLHDCAKSMHGSELVAICEKAYLNVTAVERSNPTALLHAKVGAYLAERKYGVTDEDILNAIRYHTTGRPNMSRLEKMVYIADYIEPGRKQNRDLDLIRRLAYQDLDSTMEKILSDTLAYLRTTEGQIDDMTNRTYQYYKR